jgi:predicted ATPase
MLRGIRLTRTFVQRVQIQNYRSIASCDVCLHPFTLLVGPNGSGKSNFLDALRFVADGLRSTLEHAIRDRGGIDQVRRRSGGHPNHFGIALYLDLPSGESAHFAFRIGARPKGGFEVQRETCTISAPPMSASDRIFYCVEKGVLGDFGGADGLPRLIESDRLFLSLVSALPVFRPVYDGLQRLGFYNLNPEQFRDLQDPDPGQLLARDGHNIASVVRRMSEESPDTWGRVLEYLRAVVPGVRGVRSRSVLAKETLEFDQDVAGSRNPWRFPASGMSDGTLRALGVLVAVFQGVGSIGRPIPLIGIEEPEAAIHPGAAVKLVDALYEAQNDTQILVTTHSPEILDHPEIVADQILAVEVRDGTTIVGPVNLISREVMRGRLYSAGDLLRLDQLSPSDEAVAASSRQLRLFDTDDLR